MSAGGAGGARRVVPVARWLVAVLAVVVLAVAPLVTGGVPAGAQLSPSTTVPAGEVGLGVAPAVLDVPATPPGATRTVSLILSNALPSDRLLVLEPAGDVAPWLLFLDDGGVRATEVLVPGRGQALVDVRVTVPPDAPSGPAAGRIEITSRPGEDAIEVVRPGTRPGPSSGASATTGASPPTTATPGTAEEDLSLSVVVPVRVEVGGDAVAQGRMTDVVAPAAEVGQPQDLVVRFSNTGTVAFRPAVEATITRGGVPIVTLASPGDQEVDAGRSEDVTLTWDTAEALPGAYDVQVTATADGLAFDPLATSFTLAPAGTVERSGTLESFEVVGRTEPGGTAKLRAEFRNRSDVAVEAVLLVETTADGDLLGQERSLPLVVPARRTAAFEVVLDDLQVGRYEAAGKVNFDGRETEQATAGFDVRLPLAGGGGGSSRRLLLGAGALGLVAAVGAVVLVRRRRATGDEDDFDDF